MHVLATGGAIQQAGLFLFVIVIPEEPRKVHLIIVQTAVTVIFSAHQSGKFHSKIGSDLKYKSIVTVSVLVFAT
jgi:hypothetical protein